MGQGFTRRHGVHAIADTRNSGTMQNFGDARGMSREGDGSITNYATSSAPLGEPQFPVMAQTAPLARGQLRHLPVMAIPVCLFVLVLSLQWLSFAYTRELGSDPDEPAHYITGLLVHDYVAAGMPSRPMAFAENYYLHYPKVALGHWPPFFYVVQTLWTLPFGASRTSVMLLMACLTTAFAVIVQRTVREEQGLAGSLMVATMLICLPAVHYGASRVMSESLEGLLCFVALRSWARKLKGDSPGSLREFACFAILAILTKGTGLLLAVVPGVSLLLLRRLRDFAKPSFWAAGLLVAALCLPVYTLLPNTGLPALRTTAGLRLNLATIGTFPKDIVTQTGIAGACLIAVGIASCVWRAIRGSAMQETPAVACAAVAGLLILRTVTVAAVESRHLAIIAGPLMQLLACGAVTTARKSRQWWPRYPVRGTWLILIAAAASLFTSLPTIPKTEWGIGRLVSELAGNPSSYGNVFLISSNSAGEGAWIAETAMREARPGHYILRASQVLADESWSGRQSRPRFSGAEEIRKYLDTVPVSTVIVLQRPGMIWRPYQLELQHVLRAHPDIWSERSMPPDADHPHGTFRLVYRRVIPVDTSHPRIVLHPDGNKLGRPLRN